MACWIAYQCNLCDESIAINSFITWWCHTLKEAAQLLTKLPHGSNNPSAPNTSIYGFKVLLQPTFPHHTNAAGKHTTQTQRCVPKNSNRVVASRKALPGRCQIVVVRSCCICRLGYCWYGLSSEGWLYSSYLVALAFPVEALSSACFINL